MSALWLLLAICVFTLTACAVVWTWALWASSDAGIRYRRRRALRRNR